MQALCIQFFSFKKLFAVFSRTTLTSWNPQLYFQCCIQLWRVSVYCVLGITHTGLYLWYIHSVRLVMESRGVVIHVSDLDVHRVLHHLHQIHTFYLTRSRAAVHSKGRMQEWVSEEVSEWVCVLTPWLSLTENTTCISDFVCKNERNRTVWQENTHSLNYS